MKIDIFSHIVPKQYGDALRKKAKEGTLLSPIGRFWSLDSPDSNLALNDIEVRLRLMDRYPDVMQVLTVAEPPLEMLVPPADAVELARIANDELAELVNKYPDKFIAAAACLPLNDIDAAVKEAERAITQLHLRGIQMFTTNINSDPVDAPRFKPLYERMAYYNLPIWIHPWGKPALYSGRNLPESIKNFGWPIETSAAMACLVEAGIFKDYPDIKFITHHCGGMIPFFERRIEMAEQKVHYDYFRRFYNDTAVYGNTSALMCGYAFFGAEHLLFGTDAPLGRGSLGNGYTLETIRSIEQMNIPNTDKEKIFEGNAVRLLQLAI